MENITPQLELPKTTASSPNKPLVTIASQTFTVFPNLSAEIRLSIWDLAIASRLRSRLVRLVPKTSGNRLPIPDIPHVCSESRAQCAKQMQNYPELSHCSEFSFTLPFDHDRDFLLLNYYDFLELQHSGLASCPGSMLKMCGIENLELNHVRQLALTLRSIDQLEKNLTQQRGGVSFIWSELLNLCPVNHQVLIIVPEARFIALGKVPQVFEVEDNSSGFQRRWKVKERPDLKNELGVSGCIIDSSCFQQKMNRLNGWEVFAAVVESLNTTNRAGA